MWLLSRNWHWNTHQYSGDGIYAIFINYATTHVFGAWSEIIGDANSRGIGSLVCIHRMSRYLHFQSPRRWLECIYGWNKSLDRTIDMLQYLPWVLGKDASEGEYREILEIIIIDSVSWLPGLQQGLIFPSGILLIVKLIVLWAPRFVVEITRASRVIVE